MSNNSFLKHTAVYGLGSVLTQAAGFVLLPLYARCLSPGDFGALEIIQRVSDVVLVCLLLNGIRQATLAFYNQAESDEERRRVVTAALLLATLSGLLSAGFLYGAAGTLESSLGQVPAELFRLNACGVFFSCLTIVPLALLQARVESAYFVASSFGQFALRIPLVILLLYYLGWGVAGTLWATIITAGVFGVVLSVRELVRGGGPIDLKILGQMMWFALPFLPGGLGGFILNNGDRFFLLEYSDAEAVGVYALGYKLAWAVGFPLIPIGMVWSAQMYAVAKQPDAAAVFSRMFTRIHALQIAIGLAVCLLQDEIVHLVSGRHYDGAAIIIAPVVLAYFFVSAAGYWDAVFYVRRKTVYKIPITILGTAGMVICYAVLIPMYGVLGAAMATLLGYVFYATLTYGFAQRVFPIRYEIGRLSLMLVLAILLWFGSRLLPDAGWSILAKVGLGLIWPILVWHLGILPERDREWLKTLWNSQIRPYWPSPTPPSSSTSARTIQPACQGRRLEEAPILPDQR